MVEAYQSSSGTGEVLALDSDGLETWLSETPGGISRAPESILVGDVSGEGVADVIDGDGGYTGASTGTVAGPSGSPILPYSNVPPIGTRRRPADP